MSPSRNSGMAVILKSLGLVLLTNQGAPVQSRRNLLFLIRVGEVSNQIGVAYVVIGLMSVLYRRTFNRRS